MLNNFMVKCEWCGYENYIKYFDFDHDGNICCPKCENKENLGIA